MTQAPRPPFVMTLGPDLEAAQALAEACGVRDTLATFDAAALAQALRSDRTCLLVWSGLNVTLACALRDGLPPTAAAATWADVTRELIPLADTTNLTLIEAETLRKGDLTGLPLSRALPPLSPLPLDIHDLVAALMLAHMPDLQGQDQVLRHASLGNRPAPPADLDDLARRLRDLMPPAPLPPTAILDAETSQSPQGDEVRLLRDHLAYLLADVGLGSTSDLPPLTDGITPVATQLLSELVQETDRRIRTEQHLRLASAALRRAGIDALALGTAVGPRPAA